MNDGDGAEPGRPTRLGPRLARTLLRLVGIVLIALAASWLVSTSMTLATRLPDAAHGPMQTTILLTALLVYALLIATPFVPGIEIGLALLVLRGASIAPAVYSATVAGLILAYFIGRLVPEASLERTFRDLKLTRAANLIGRYRAMPIENRQATLQSNLPKWLALPAVRYRYLTLGLLINLPGNAIFGGGGGLMLAAGLSRLFAPTKTIVTLLIAVLPLPIGFWFFGSAILTGLA